MNTPFDDIPARAIGIEAGLLAFHAIKGIFYKDRDRDGYLSYIDCDDNNPKVNPGAEERCDGLDNDCNGKIDDVEPPCGGG
jgi:Protein metal binding site.